MSSLPHIAVILAAGMGTRMLPATKSLAKPMLPIINRPTIDYLVTDFADAGIKEFIIVGKSNMEQIETYLDRNIELERLLKDEGKDSYYESITKFNQLKFTFVRQAYYAGTGDAVKSILHLIPPQTPIIASYADVLMYPRTCLKEMLTYYKKFPGTYVPVCTVPKSEVSHYGIARPVENIAKNLYRIDGIVEKPKMNESPSQFGLFSPMILAPEVLTLLHSWKSADIKDILGLSNAIGENAAQHPTYIFDCQTEPLDTGLPEGYLKAQIRFAMGQKDLKQKLLPYLKALIAEEEK